MTSDNKQETRGFKYTEGYQANKTQLGSIQGQHRDSTDPETKIYTENSHPHKSDFTLLNVALRINVYISHFMLSLQTHTKHTCQK